MAQRFKLQAVSEIIANAISIGPLDYHQIPSWESFKKFATPGRLFTLCRLPPRGHSSDPLAQVHEELVCISMGDRWFILPL